MAEASATQPHGSVTLIDLEEDQQGTDAGSVSARFPKKAKLDPIWEYFLLDTVDASKAICNTCEKKISRGGTGRGATSTGMSNHLKVHPIEHSTYQQKKVPSIVQPTIKAAFEGMKKWDINDPRAVKYHYLIGEMIAIDTQPYSFPEDKGFRRLMNHAAPRYQVPGRTYFTTKIIPDIYQRCKPKVKQNLSEAKFWSFTTDIWTEDTSKEAYISLTAHWLSPDFEFKSSVLNSSHFPESHTGNAIALKLDQLFKDWELNPEKRHLIIRDNARNMCSGLNDFGFPSESCFIHTLQLAINDSIKSQRMVSDVIAISKNIATHFSHSGLACTRLQGIQKQLNLPEHTIIQDVATRWNSTYYMLQRLVEQRDAITFFSGEGHITNLNENQWKIAESTLALLQPLEEITKMISESESVISEVIPNTVILSRYLDKKNPSLHSGVGTLKSELRTSVRQRFADIFQNPNYTVATFLDPRFKITYFKQDQQQTIKSEVLDLLLELWPDAQEEAFPVPVPPARGESRLNAKVHSAFWDCDNELREANIPQSEANPTGAGSIGKRAVLEKEIEVYTSSFRPIDRKQCPFQWWKLNSKIYPNLAKLTFKFLSAPASSVFSERLFSTEGRIYEDCRNRLLPKNGEMLTFLNTNLPSLEFQY